MKPKAIKQLRKTYNLTQHDLAKLVGVRQATVSDWERGAVKPSRLALAQIDAFVWRIRANAEADWLGETLTALKEACDWVENRLAVEGHPVPASMSLLVGWRRFLKATSARKP